MENCTDLEERNEELRNKIAWLLDHFDAFKEDRDFVFPDGEQLTVEDVEAVLEAK